MDNSSTSDQPAGEGQKLNFPTGGNEAEITDRPTVNVAVIGELGSGRTSFINSARGLDDGCDCAAPTGDAGLTAEPQVYPHPNCSNLQFWLLPEISGVASEAEAYLKQVHFEQYHIFIFVFHQHLHESYARLAALVEKAEKPVLFVRTNIDRDLRKVEDGAQSQYEEIFMAEIKKDCLAFLEMQGVASTQVFVVANLERNKHDFPYLRILLEKGNVPKSDSSAGEVEKLGAPCYDNALPRAVSETEANDPSPESIDVSIAVLGKPESGKSALINGIRGVSEADEGAAPIGVREEAQDPVVYNHPMFPGLRLREIQVPENLTTIPQCTEQYISDADIIIVLTCDSFTDDYAAIVKGAHSAKKKVYFVRTKVDVELHTLKRKMRHTYDQQAILEELRKLCICDLQAFSVVDPSLFLLSNFEPDKFDFHCLQKTLLQDIKERDYLNSFDIISEDEIEEIRAAYHTGGLSAFVSKIQCNLDALQDARLDIGVTGESGCGKSSFINALRGLEDEDEAAAKTGVIETTIEPTEYPYLRCPNISLWDLPGMGTPNFTADTYLQKMNFGRYDFFFILASERFKENHMKLAKEIQMRDKKFYFIRTKIDNDMNAEKRKKKSMDETEVLDKIRQDCIQNFEKEDLHPKVFLLSSFQLAKYDFPLFEETLVKELTGYKKRIFLMSLPNISAEIIRKKKEHLQEEAWKIAAVSSLVAAVPIPGLSVACDVYVLTKHLSAYQVAFGLDDQSLSKLAEKLQIPIEELKAQIRSPFGSEVTKELVVNLVSKAAGGGFILADLLYSRFPFLGSIAAGSISYRTTYAVLTQSLEDLASDSQKVLMKALENKSG